MIELRDYQQDLLVQMHRALASTRVARIMLQLPTGSGKTRIAGELLSGWLKDGRKAVWLTHRKELATQTEGMLREAGVTATANMQWTPRTNAPTLLNGVVILMAQTVSRRNGRANVWDGYNRSDLMIIDEAHHATADGWARAIKQWPGPVVGMTATPWRLSQREGFDHLFKELHCGPQVAALQSDKWLCQARVMLPPEGERVQAGQVDYTGDYSESGIELANEDRDVWTAGALRFWQKHCENRQTVVYAVSVRHAQNLVAMFSDAGVPTGVLLGDTPTAERSRLLHEFQDGTIKALVNVAVATEGFDLPDAACVMLTRPTMSLSLYLQMVGRGLRPKQDDGDCVILDLAGNSLRHGLPDEERDWSLQPRCEQPSVESPVVLCQECASLSPLGSHQCRNCGAPFGEPCGRCGAWRAWIRWSRKTVCGKAHDLVCDLCHYDAHIQARLPVTEELKELAMLANDDELSPHRDPFLKNFLEEERRRIGGSAEDRKEELRFLIGVRESELADDNVLYKLFENHLTALPTVERPQTRPQESRLFSEWEGGFKQELVGWRKELATLESQSIDGQLIFNNARDQLMRLFEAEARDAGLLPGKQIREMPLQGPDEEYSSRASLDSDAWMTFGQLKEWSQNKLANGNSTKPSRLQSPEGKEIDVSSWADLLLETSEWLIRKGLLTKDDCPVTTGRMAKRYLIHVTPVHPSGHKFVSSAQLSNGLYLERSYNVNSLVQQCELLLERFDQDPAQFHVRLRQ